MAEVKNAPAARPVGCVIMASGQAVRFGSNKLLADFCGQPLLCRAFAATGTPLLAARIVVTRSAEVEELCRTAGIPCLRHALPGRNDTVRLGLDALRSACPELSGCIFLPGDQPLLRRATLEGMIRAFAQTQKETELQSGSACTRDFANIDHWSDRILFNPWWRSHIAHGISFGKAGGRYFRRMESNSC